MKNIVITGASRGIGLGLAAHYGAQGSDVLGVVRQAPEPLRGVTWAEADVVDLASLTSVAQTVASPDLLVCNAGVYLDRDLDVFSANGAEWSDTFAVNVEGVFRTIQAFVPRLDAGSKIAIIASQMGSSERAGGGSYIYRASKAAAVNLGRNLAIDLEAKGIAVGVYHPGWVRTDMGTDAASIDVDTSVAGLVARFVALNIEKTGCFENYDGSVMPF